MTDPATHRWSGWPGAWCLDCGAPDPFEQGEADGLVDADGVGPITFASPEAEAAIRAAMVCHEPGSRRFDPYARDADPTA
jgi:hypothetical protein